MAKSTFARERALGFARAALVGYALVSCGTLTGAVTAGGRLSISYQGKSVVKLKAGRYTISVVDKSATSGFLVQKLRRARFHLARELFPAMRSDPPRAASAHGVPTPAGS